MSRLFFGASLASLVLGLLTAGCALDASTAGEGSTAALQGTLEAAASSSEATDSRQTATQASGGDLTVDPVVQIGGLRMTDPDRPPPLPWHLFLLDGTPPPRNGAESPSPGGQGGQGGQTGQGQSSSNSGQGGK